MKCMNVSDVENRQIFHSVPAEEIPALGLRGAMVCLHQLHDFMPYLGPNASTLMTRILDDVFAARLNCLLVEYEAMYPWSGEHARISCKDAFTPQDIAELNREAEMRGIQLIPLVQTLGHVYHILQHDAYRDCRELPDQIQQLCPSNPKSFGLICELLDDVIAHHPNSHYLHLGGDECRLLGQCPRCQELAACSPGGEYQLYVDYYREVTDYILSQGKIPILWHDIAIKEPKVLECFDSRVMFHFWNYGDHCRGVLEREFEILNSRIPAGRIIGGPGLRCDVGHGSLFPSFRLIFDNLRRMNHLMRQAGTAGSIVTDWPDSGISFLLSVPLFQLQGQATWPAEFSIDDFAEAYYGVKYPELFLHLDAIYGWLPLTKGFQSELTDSLNRYQFRPYDFARHLNSFLEALEYLDPDSYSCPEFNKMCHRRMLCRDLIDQLDRLSPQYHLVEWEAMRLAVRTLQLMLTLTIGLTAGSWQLKKQLKAGYQLTPEKIIQDLQDYLDGEPQLRTGYRSLYQPLCVSVHLENFLDMLFKKEFRENAEIVLHQLHVFRGI